jgi:hypothetical protein
MRYKCQYLHQFGERLLPTRGHLGESYWGLTRASRAGMSLSAELPACSLKAAIVHHIRLVLPASPTSRFPSHGASGQAPQIQLIDPRVSVRESPKVVQLIKHAGNDKSECTRAEARALGSLKKN